MRKIVPKQSKQDIADLGNMFEQMLGNADAASEILIPKITNLGAHLLKISKVLGQLASMSALVELFPEQKADFAKIGHFAEELKTVQSRIPSEEKLRAMTTPEINVEYKTICECPLVKEMIITTAKLVRFKNFIEDKSDLRGSFVLDEPGMTLFPLSFSAMEIKAMWTSEKSTHMLQKFILNVLHNLYIEGMRVHKIISSPNVNIKDFSGVLAGNIDQLRASVPRCNEAFDMIMSSVSLLEDNFDSYYKMSVESQNPSVIMESFVIDVASKQQQKPMAMLQFRRIIKHIQEKTNNGKRDPRISKLFSMIHNNFKLMDEGKVKLPSDELIPVEIKQSGLPSDTLRLDSPTDLSSGVLSPSPAPMPSPTQTPAPTPVPSPSTTPPSL